MRQGHENVKVFRGMEVEASPALGKQTMFVVGLHPIETIENLVYLCHGANKIEHLYFGANQSFKIPETSSAEHWDHWSKLIKHFLDQGFWCTLDLDVRYISSLHETGLCEYDGFIPMISVPIPHIRLLNYNATVKIDDQSMAYSNPGVWCHQVHDLQNREVFTDWSKYSQDQVML